MATDVRQGARAWWLRISRDQWKAKLMEVRKETKRLKVRVHDLEQSRCHWRERAESLEAELKTLRQEQARPPVAQVLKKRN